MKIDAGDDWAAIQQEVSFLSIPVTRKAVIAVRMLRAHYIYIILSALM